MAKSRKEIQRELYNFIADQDEPVIQQTISDKYCKKYSCSPRTISRYLEEMCNSKNPFHLRTWYDKNRYYDVPGLTIGARIASLLSLGIPLTVFFVDLYGLLPIKLFDKVVFFIIGFWIAKWLDAIKKDGIRHSKK